MNYKPYPAYKDSCIEWLGEIPQAWDTLRIGFFYSRVKETDRADLPLLSVYREYGVIPKDSRDDNFNNASEDLSTYQVVQENDLVINKMKAWQGSLGISHYEGIVSPAYFVLRPKQDCTDSFDKQFFHYLLRSQIYFAEYEKRSKGIRINQWDLPYEEFKTISVLLPPILTQKAIAAFLDTRTARIDGLVRDYEELVSLLNEKRQALISHAVTRGLSELVSPDDPEFGEWAQPVAFKDSGVEWLGEIPEGWAKTRLRFLAKLNPSKNELGTDHPAEISFLPMDNIGDDGTLRLDTTRKWSEVESGYSYFSEGDIAYAIITPCFENGKGAQMVGLYNGCGFGTTELCILRPQKTCDGRWLWYLTTSEPFRKIGESYMYGAGGQKRVPDDFARNFSVGIPPLQTQKAIATYLDRETAKIDALVAEAEGAIELLKERRSALITAAVTGKINVEEIEVV